MEAFTRDAAALMTRDHTISTPNALLKSGSTSADGQSAAHH